MKRLPNGYGSVVFLGNNRSKPYATRKTSGYDKNGKQKYVYIDFYRTRQEALQALIDLNKADIEVDLANVTFAQLFDMWWRDCKIDERPKGSTNAFKTSFNHCSELHNIKVRKIKKKDMQDIMDSKPGYQTRSNIKNLCNQMLSYAVDSDIVIKNYASNLNPGSSDSPKNPHKVIDDAAMKLLATYTNRDLSDLFLAMLYTGARIDEILGIKSDDVYPGEQYMVGGNKTPSGKKRIIPIASRILPVVNRRLLDGGETLFSYKNGESIPYDNMRYHINQFNIKNGCSVKSHDCRHTFFTAMNKLGVKKSLYQKIAGHKGDDVTDDVYTHYTVRDMLDAVNKLDAIYNV